MDSNLTEHFQALPFSTGVRTILWAGRDFCECFEFQGAANLSLDVIREKSSRSRMATCGTFPHGALLHWRTLGREGSWPHGSQPGGLVICHQPGHWMVGGFLSGFVHMGQMDKLTKCGLSSDNRFCHLMVLG